MDGILLVQWNRTIILLGVDAAKVVITLNLGKEGYFFLFFFCNYRYTRFSPVPLTSLPRTGKEKNANDE